MQPQSLSELRAVYLGDPLNTILPPGLATQVEVVNARTGAEFEAALTGLGGFNLHYCIRGPRNDDRVVAKPFTKGFTAAACGSAVLVDHDEFDALQLLGEDYPYIVRDKTEAGIRASLDQARADFGGPRWHEAVERVRKLDRIYAPEQIARQLVALIDELDGV